MFLGEHMYVNVTHRSVVPLPRGGESVRGLWAGVGVAGGEGGQEKQRQHQSWVLCS